MRYLFEDYAFDTDRRELHRGAELVSIAPQVFDLLDYLIRNRERVVSKDDLINAVWNGRIVSDAALTTRLNVARSAIGDGIVVHQEGLVSRITRRTVLTTACSIAIATVANADSLRRWRVGLVTSGSGERIIGWFREAFRSMGYREGNDLIIDLREAKGHYSLLPGLVSELIALKPDVIIAEATPAIAAAQRATSTIPIVMSPATDPVGSGFVKSFTRPGGNITGTANMFADLTAKTLDIIRLLFPKVQKIGLLTSNNPVHPAMAQTATNAAEAIGISVQRFIAPNPEDLEKAFADMKAADCEVVYVLADPPRDALPSIALKYRLPTVYQIDTYPDRGGLMAYGPDLKALFLLAAGYVDRILKGAKPADLPVEQPTKFAFVINLRTAKALGLTVPEQVLLMADRVIE